MNVIHIDPNQLPARPTTAKRNIDHEQLMHVVDDTTIAAWLLDE